MFEVWRADDPLAAVEGHLREAGFFGGGAEDVVADLYLGYALSHASRRTPVADPPEPCSLPLAAVRVRPLRDASRPAGGFAVGEWKRTWDDEGYSAAVVAVREAIARGDVYQVNLVQHLSAPFAGNPAGLAGRLAPLRPLHPRPLAGAGWTVVSASPELFLARRGRRIWTKPIKGTRPAGVRGELREAEKDGAEHVMIVDLERNDLSRVCEPGSVRWPELMTERELAGVTTSSPPSRDSCARTSVSRSCCGPRSRAARSRARPRSRPSTTSQLSSRSAAGRRWAPSAGFIRTATSTSLSRSGPSPSPTAASTSGWAAGSSGTPIPRRRSRSPG